MLPTVAAKVTESPDLLGFFDEAVSLIVAHDMTAVGRLLLDCEHERRHVIDVALLPA